MSAITLHLVSFSTLFFSWVYDTREMEQSGKEWKEVGKSALLMSLKMKLGGL